MEVTAEEFCIWPEEIKVVSNIPLKVSHEELSSEVIGKVVSIHVRPDHGKKSSITVLRFVRQHSYHASQVDTTKEGHENKNLQE